MNIFAQILGFFSNRKEKKIERCVRLVKNAKAIREDRIYAIDFFANHADPAVAVPGLLPRFDYSLEHGINDAREKDSAMAGVVKHEKAANEFVKAHLKATTRIAWPIKILMKLNDEREMAAILESSLDFNDVSFDQAIVDKNYDLLCYLADYDAFIDLQKIQHFLRDPDERVRFAAVEVLVKNNHPTLQSALETFVFDDSAENRRIRAAVIDAFIRFGWQLSATRPLAEGLLVDGVFVTKSGKLERR